MTNTETRETEELFLEERHRDLARRVAGLGDELSGVESVGEALPRVAAAGLLEVAFPAAGAEPDLRSLCVVQQELSRLSIEAGQAFEAQVGGGQLLALAGAGSEQAKLLAEVRAGERVAALALAEDGVGEAVRTTARAEGEEYVLDGSKSFIRSAGTAQIFLVLARTGEGDDGLTFFLVESGAPGARIVPRRLLGDPAAVDLYLEGCRVAVSGRLGEAGSGAALVERCQRVLGPLAGAAALGLAAHALDEALRRMRSVEGAVPQATQHALADMATELDGARLLVERAAAEHDAGRPRADLAAMAKLFATEAAGRIVDAAVQVTGEAGLVEGSVLERLFRAVRLHRLEFGASGSQRDRLAREIV